MGGKKVKRSARKKPVISLKVKKDATREGVSVWMYACSYVCCRKGRGVRLKGKILHLILSKLAACFCHTGGLPKRQRVAAHLASLAYVCDCSWAVRASVRAHWHAGTSLLPLNLLFQVALWLSQSIPVFGILISASVAEPVWISSHTCKPLGKNHYWFIFMLYLKEAALLGILQLALTVLRLKLYSYIVTVWMNITL